MFVVGIAYVIVALASAWLWFGPTGARRADYGQSATEYAALCRASRNPICAKPGETPARDRPLRTGPSPRLLPFDKAQSFGTSAPSNV
jgi:hypothetical protein